MRDRRVSPLNVWIIIWLERSDSALRVILTASDAVSCKFPPLPHPRAETSSRDSSPIIRYCLRPLHCIDLRICFPPGFLIPASRNDLRRLMNLNVSINRLLNVYRNLFGWHSLLAGTSEYGVALDLETRVAFICRKSRDREWSVFDAGPKILHL